MRVHGLSASRIALMLILVIGMSSAAGCARLHAGVATRPISHPVFRSITHAPVGLITVDPASGTIYGVAAGGIIAIDTSDREHRVFAIGTHDYICGLAIDGTDHHLLVDVARFDHPSSGRNIPPATALVQVIDASSGRILNTVSIEHNRPICLFGSAELTAIDPTAGHGFVTDTTGQSVEVDMDTGAIVRRYHIPPPWYFVDYFPADALPWVVDSVSHRLVISTLDYCRNSCTPPILLITVNTMSGRIVRRARYPEASNSRLALDATTARVYFRSDVLGEGKIFTLNDRSGRITAHVRVAQLFDSGDLTGNVVADSSNHRVYIYIGGAALKGSGFPGRHNGPAHLFEINGQGTRVLRRVNFPNPGNGVAGAAVVDPATDRLFVQVGERLLVIDLSTLHVIQTIRLTRVFNGKYTSVILDTTNHRILFYGSGGIMALNEK